jgi:FADH2 O2-dependent halogenase
LKRDVDLAVVGAGFGGSLMAMIAHQLGLSVVLLEQGRHPRMAIGESTTPLSNLLLERLSATYDLPRIAPLAKWGSWQRTYPQIACGLKRGFTFFHQEGELLVAASPHDNIADTHWYRADVDHFLVTEAQRLGVDYRDSVRIETLDFAEDGASIIGRAGEETFHLRARLLIDATGPRGFLHRSLGWRSLLCLGSLLQKACTATSRELHAPKLREMNLPIRLMTPPCITYLMADGCGSCDSIMGSLVLGSQRLAG